MNNDENENKKRKVSEEAGANNDNKQQQTNGNRFEILAKIDSADDENSTYIKNKRTKM